MIEVAANKLLDSWVPITSCDQVRRKLEQQVKQSTSAVR